MELKALAFDIVGTVFDVYDGLSQGVGPLNSKYGLIIPGGGFAEGSLAGYADGIAQASQTWTPLTPFCRTPPQRCCHVTGACSTARGERPAWSVFERSGYRLA